MTSPRTSLASVLLSLLLLTVCGTMAPPSAPSERELDSPRVGKLSLQYTGGCTGREAELIHVARLDESALIFDDFHLLRDESGHFIGSADFIAPMPADGRDIVYTVSYSLSLSEGDEFIGTEKITEGGGHSLDCPVELLYIGALRSRRSCSWADQARLLAQPRNQSDSRPLVASPPHRRLW